MKEIPVTGQYYRILVDKANKIWHRLSFWTKASDVEFSDGSLLQDKTFGHKILERSTDYVVGDIAYCTNAPSWAMLLCKVSGKTAPVEPIDYKAIQLSGVELTDGTCTFVIQDKRFASRISDDSNTKPTVKVMKDSLAEATKEAKDSNELNVYVGNEGKLHFVNKDGEDNALDFDPHNGTYTFPVGDMGETKDLGEIHGIKYVNASEVYTKGYTDGATENITTNIHMIYHHHVHSTEQTNLTDGGVDTLTNEVGEADDAHIYSDTPKGCYTVPYYENRTEGCPANKGYTRSSWHEQRPWSTPGYAGFYDDIDHVTLKCNVCGKSWEAENHDPSTPAHNRVVNKQVGYSIGCGMTRGKLVRQDIIYD